MAAITIRIDDDIHRKLKIIAATQDISLNVLFQTLFQQEVNRWEAKYGTLQPVDENS